MSKSNEEMSGLYKVVFAFAILMMLGVFFGGAMSNSKSSGLGVYYWGYTAWLMYKRNDIKNESLQKSFLYIIGSLFILGFFILLFGGDEIRRMVPIEPFSFLLIGVVFSLFPFLLYQFFKSVNSTNSDISETGLLSNRTSEVYDDKYWLKASLEIKNGAMDEVTWAKSFAQSGGDESKAKALYLNMRVQQLSDNLSENEFESDLRKTQSDAKPLFSNDDLRLSISALKEKYSITEYNLADATNEFNSDGRQVDLWNECIQSGANSADAKRRYIIIRAQTMAQTNYKVSSDKFHSMNRKTEDIFKDIFGSSTSSVSSNEVKIDYKKANRDVFINNVLHYLSIAIGISLLIFIVYGISSDSKSKQTAQSQTTNQVSEAKSVESYESKDKADYVVEEVNDGMCYVYWDGWKFIKGKIKSDKFLTLGIERYDVEVLRLSLPSEMAQDSFGINKSNATNISVQTGSFGTFFQAHLSEISTLCSFQ